MGTQLSPQRSATKGANTKLLLERRNNCTRKDMIERECMIQRQFLATIKKGEHRSNLRIMDKRGYLDMTINPVGVTDVCHVLCVGEWDVAGIWRYDLKGFKRCVVITYWIPDLHMEGVIVKLTNAAGALTMQNRLEWFSSFDIPHVQWSKCCFFVFLPSKLKLCESLFGNRRRSSTSVEAQLKCS